MTELSKARKLTGWIISGLLVSLFLFSALGKFMMPEVAENFSKWGIADWRIIIAFGEIISAILFLIPRTNILGLLLLSSHMGGAIMVHMSHQESFIFQAVILVLIWVAGFLRNPELLTKLKG